MAGALVAHAPGGAQDTGDEATWIVSGTGTSNDGKRVRGTVAVDSATGLPSSGRSGTTSRSAGVLHRNAIAAADKLAAPAALSALSSVGGGSLTTSTTYYLAAAAGNAWGVTTLSNSGAAQSQATGANTAIQFTLAQVAGATNYQLFLSVDVNAPKWVASITEAQRADPNGVIVSGVGTVIAGSALGVGVIQIRVPGTLAASTAAAFLNNTAYTPAGVTPINCAGYSRAHVKALLTVTGYGVTPALTLVPFFGNQLSGAAFHAGLAQPLPLVTGPGQALGQEMVVDVDGEPAFSVLVDAIAGSGAAVSVWVELA